jgi:glycosyltransferase involved in cell wall biosynthesis
MIKVLIVEPVIPHYRTALFQGLAGTGKFNLLVMASRKFPRNPDSVQSPLSWADLNHDLMYPFFRYLFWQRGLRIPRDFGAGDVLVIDANPRFLSNIPLILAARRRGIGIVSWGHGWSPTSKKWRAKIRYYYMNLANVILLYTDREARELSTVHQWRAPLLATNNALDQSEVAAAIGKWPEDRLSDFRVKNQVEGYKILLFCGRIRSHPSTELEVAIRALAQLKNSSRDYLLAVVGAGEAEEALRKLSVNLGVERLLRWIGPLYSEVELAPWFLSADSFVYPGAIGLSLLHAFGYGLPVITHNVLSLHNPEIAALRDMENGILFRKGDSEDLAAKIELIACNRNLRIIMSANAKRTVEIEYSMANMIKRFSSALGLASRPSSDQH